MTVLEVWRPEARWFPELPVRCFASHVSLILFFYYIVKRSNMLINWLLQLWDLQHRKMWSCWWRSTGGLNSKLKRGRFGIDIKRSSLLSGWRGSGTSCPGKSGYPIPGEVQGQVGRCPGQPDLVAQCPAYSRGLENWVDLMVCSNQTILWFSMELRWQYVRFVFRFICALLGRSVLENAPDLVIPI